MRNKQIKALTY